MKSNMTIVVALSAALLAPAGFAQGKGGGGGARGGGGGAPGHAQGNGAGVGRGAEAFPAERSEKPGRAEDAAKPNARSAKPAAQELSGSMHEINQTAFAQRKELLQSVDMRLKSSRDALKQIQANAKDLRGAARDEFKASLDAVKARERDLEGALKTTRKSTEASWEKDRGVLDRTYRDFNDAVGRLEALPRPPKL